MHATRTRARRADAERNIAAIIEAAIATFGRDPDASMADVAAAAGVGRVTLYAHFPNRQALIEATLDHVLTQGRAALEVADIDEGPAPDALTRAIESAWSVLDRHMSLYAVAKDDVSVQLRQRHEPFLARIEGLIERGRREGTFRSDLPTSWLVTTYYTMVHGAGREVVEGRLDAADAPRLLSATLLAAFAPAGSRRTR
jgi:TetR/AcrR family transcriptional regulator, mexCD-oprJ operon repressor